MFQKFQSLVLVCLAAFVVSQKLIKIYETQH